MRRLLWVLCALGVTVGGLSYAGETGGGRFHGDKHRSHRSAAALAKGHHKGAKGVRKHGHRRHGHRGQHTKGKTQ